MTTNEEEIIDSQTDAEETENDAALEIELDDSEESEIEELRKKVATLEHQKDHYRKKADAAASAKKPQEAASELSQADIIAIVRNEVHEDDIDDVKSYAKLKGIPFRDALKSSVVRTILSENAEKRATAEASHAGTPRRTQSKPTDEQVLSKASKGEYPEDVESLVAARLRARGA